MPRIIAGRFKGFRLASPTGRATRPTADQVKEALFSMLLSLKADFTGTRVLDFFAGSGSLGLEALSRGARSAVFADHSRPALEVLGRNLRDLGLTDGAEIIRTRWPQGFQRLAGHPPFDLFFLDPPYAETRLPLKLLNEAAQRGLAAPGAWAVWEQDPETLSAWTAAEAHPWQVVKTRVWGGRAAAFLLHQPDETQGAPI